MDTRQTRQTRLTGLIKIQKWYCRLSRLFLPYPMFQPQRLQHRRPLSLRHKCLPALP